MANRGNATRDALLNAAEALISDNGFASPSHRAITSAAGVHLALLNYHFGSKEMLFEAAVARRADRLSKSWREAIAMLSIRSRWQVEDVLAAWWHPFHAIRRDDEDGEWRNYACVIARLASAVDGETWHQRHFETMDSEFLRLLELALPTVARVDLESGLRYARTLFSEVLLHRCGKTGGSCTPRGFRDDDIDRLIRFLAHGLRGLREGVVVAAN